jgi:four helix bundle protein
LSIINYQLSQWVCPAITNSQSNAAALWFELEVVYLEEDRIKFKSQIQKSISKVKLMMSKKNVFSDKIFNFEDRLVRFAGECIFFTRNLNKSFENEYYKNQLIRSSGSSSLNFGESQGAITDKDVIFKLGLVVKELKESRNSLKILNYINEGNEEFRILLLTEVEELIAISSKMIINKK